MKIVGFVLAALMPLSACAQERPFPIGNSKSVQWVAPAKASKTATTASVTVITPATKRDGEMEHQFQITCDKPMIALSIIAASDRASYQDEYVKSANTWTRLEGDPDVQRIPKRLRASNEVLEQQWSTACK